MSARQPSAGSGEGKTTRSAAANIQDQTQEDA